LYPFVPVDKKTDHTDYELIEEEIAQTGNQGEPPAMTFRMTFRVTRMRW
jgi:hypothetical protein